MYLLSEMDLDVVNETLLNENISKFQKDFVNENGWSNRTLHLMRVTLNDCKIRTEKHTLKAFYYSRLHKLFALPSLVFSSVATSLAFWVVGSPEVPSLNLSVSIAILSAISSLIKAIESTYRFNIQEQDHKIAVHNYGRLARQIELYVIQPDSNAKETLRDIKKDYENILMNSPYIFVSTNFIKV